MTILEWLEMKINWPIIVSILSVASVWIVYWLTRKNRNADNIRQAEITIQKQEEKEDQLRAWRFLSGRYEVYPALYKRLNNNREYLETILGNYKNQQKWNPFEIDRSRLNDLGAQADSVIKKSKRENTDRIHEYVYQYSVNIRKMANDYEDKVEAILNITDGEEGKRVVKEALELADKISNEYQEFKKNAKL